MDESHFFNRNSGAFKRISDQLRKLELDHGYKIYLVVEPVLIATTPSELAAELRQAWVPDGNGLVLVFESDSRQLGNRPGFGKPPGSIRWRISSQVPSHETSAMLAARHGIHRRQAWPRNLTLKRSSANLVREHEGYFSRRAEPPPPERSVKIGLLIVGTLALLGLGAIAVGGLGPAFQHDGGPAVSVSRWWTAPNASALPAAAASRPADSRRPSRKPESPATQLFKTGLDPRPPLPDRQMMRQNRGEQMHDRIGGKRQSTPNAMKADDEIAHRHRRPRRAGHRALSRESAGPAVKANR